MATKFWGHCVYCVAAFEGVEVKSGLALKVIPAGGLLLHLSQANVGELKKKKGDRTTVSLFVNVNGKKLVLGTLFTDKLPQQQFDLVFDRTFELSHNCKRGSVYFYGYWTLNHDNNSSSEEEEKENSPVDLANNVKPESKTKEQKAAEREKDNASQEKKSEAGKGKAMITESELESSDEDFMSEDEDENDSEDEDNSDDDSDESEEEEEETPEKVETSKKPPVESAIKTAVPEKKAKATTPQRTDGKKGNVHVDTPYPSKPPHKTPANKPNQHTLKSEGSYSCKSCKKAFGSEKGLESHSKAKHVGGK